MNIINPSIEIMRSGYAIDYITPEEHIERVGRTCYKSEDKITNDSAAKFVSGLIKRGHEAMIEHYSLIFMVNEDTYDQILFDQCVLMSDGDAHETNKNLIDKTLRPFLRFTDTVTEDDVRCIVSGNMRAWRDYVKACVTCFGYIPQYLHGMIRCYNLFFPEFQNYIPVVVMDDKMIPITVNDLVGDFEHSVHHDITVKFICDRGVSHEIVRHRTASFAQESTRYCNYGLDKFGNEISVVMPAKWLNANIEDLTDDPAYTAWYTSNVCSEIYYFNMLKAGSTPQEARAVLTNSTKTEVIMTGNLDCWDHFFSLRCAPDAHPDIQVVANMAQGEFYDLMPERYGLCKEVEPNA